MMISLEDEANDPGWMWADGLIPGEEGSGQDLEGENVQLLITHQINQQKKKKRSFASKTFQINQTHTLVGKVYPGLDEHDCKRMHQGTCVRTHTHRNAVF